MLWFVVQSVERIGHRHRGILDNVVQEIGISLDYYLVWELTRVLEYSNQIPRNGDLSH